MQEINQHIVTYLKSINLPNILQRTDLYTLFVGILIFLFVLYFLKKMFRKNELIIKTATGENITISSSAINEIIESICAKMQGAIKPKVKLQIHGKRITLNTKIKIGINSDIGITASNLHTKIKQIFFEKLGLSEYVLINIIITGFLNIKTTKKLLNYYKKKYDLQQNCTQEIVNEGL